MSKKKEHLKGTVPLWGSQPRLCRQLDLGQIPQLVFSSVKWENSIDILGLLLGVNEKACVQLTACSDTIIINITGACFQTAGRSHHTQSEHTTSENPGQHPSHFLTWILELSVCLF